MFLIIVWLGICRDLNPYTINHCFTTIAALGRPSARMCKEQTHYDLMPSNSNKEVTRIPPRISHHWWCYLNPYGRWMPPRLQESWSCPTSSWSWGPGKMFVFFELFGWAHVKVEFSSKIWASYLWIPQISCKWKLNPFQMITDSFDMTYTLRYTYNSILFMLSFLGHVPF